MVDIPPSLFKFKKMRIISGYLFLLIMLMSCYSAYSQYDRDVLSIRGPRAHKLVLDFSNGIGEFYLDSFAQSYEIVTGSKTMSDNHGNLQFIASTCRILGKNFELMPGGENYNSVGPLIQKEWCDQNFDFRSKNIYTIPIPKKDSLYYLIYFKHRVAPELSSSKTDSLFYRTIDMSKRDGLGVVNEDEKLLYVDTSFNAKTSAFTRHDNGIDWWFITNTIEQKYFIYNIDSSGIDLMDTTRIGTPMSANEIGSGQSTFSTSGDKFAYLNEEYDIRIFDFDQKTGEFSNFRLDSTIAIPNRSFRRGVAFSGNDRFLYVNSGGFILYQYDLINNDLKSKEVIWEYDDSRDRTPDGFQWFMNSLQLGPDCKIYGVQPNGLPYFHIVHNPNGKGEDARFELGYETPAYTAGATITHPHWRTATPYEDWCDTVRYTTATTNPNTLFKDHWMVYPNPARDELSITYTQEPVRISSLSLYDQQGKLILRNEGNNISGITRINISGISSGMYFLHIYPENYENDPSLRPVVKKIVKIE